MTSRKLPTMFAFLGHMLRARARNLRWRRTSIDTLIQHVQVLTLDNHPLRRSAGCDATFVHLPGAGPGR